MGERAGYYWDLDEAGWVRFESPPAADPELVELAEFGTEPRGEDVPLEPNPA